jgi:excisionase family DNA binding protein
MIFKRSEIAALLGISARTLQRWCRSGKIPVRMRHRLTKADCELIDNTLKTNICRYLR